MFNIGQFQSEIIRPVLRALDMHSLSAEALMVGTALAESGLCHIRQRNGGPALGVYQMEPATHDDIWANFLDHRLELSRDIWRMSSFGYDWRGEVPQAKYMIGNLYYATAMSRVHYWRVPKPLPRHDDVAGLASYWKNHYNTLDGKGTITHFVQAYETYIH